MKYSSLSTHSQETFVSSAQQSQIILYILVYSVFYIFMHCVSQTRLRSSMLCDLLLTYTWNSIRILALRTRARPSTMQYNTIQYNNVTSIPRRLCLSVCLTVCPQHNSKMKEFKLGVGYPLSDTVLWLNERSQVRVRINSSWPAWVQTL